MSPSFKKVLLAYMIVKLAIRGFFYISATVYSLGDRAAVPSHLKLSKY